MAVVRLGFKGKLYRNTGTYGSPTLTAVDEVGDVDVSLEFDSEEATSRESAGVKQEEPTLLGIEISGKIREDETSTNYIAIEAATYQRLPLDVWVLTLDKETVGSRGIRCDVKNHNWTVSQGLNGVQMRDFSLKPCVSSNKTKRAIVGTGPALAYVDIDAANPA